MYTIIGVDIAKTEDLTTVNGVFTASLRLDTKPLVKMLQKVRLCAIALGRCMGVIKPKQQHIKKNRKRDAVEHFALKGRSNNWLRMHGYAMRKKALRWRYANPAFVQQKVKPITRADGLNPGIVIIDELHEYKGSIYAICSNSR